MCAIIGFVGQATPRTWPLIKAILGQLLVASEVRGKDATGFYAVPSRRGQHPVLSKRPVCAADFIRTTASWRLLGPSRVVLAHTRQATHGDPRDNRNNHPFVSDDGRFVLIHNGVVPGHREVARDQGLKLTSECDSEVILRLVEVVGCGATGLKWALRQCRGSIAVAVYDQKQETVWLARNGGRPLVVCKVRGISGTFVASMPELMVIALRRTLGEGPRPHMDLLMPLAADTITSLRTDGSIRWAGRLTAAGGFRFP
jgi:glucosamine--fructose-6-phosphate aminotransferase (isomerizing)